MRRLVQGFVAPIYRALWERPCTGGAPRLWAGLWAATCLYVALICLSLFGPVWMLVPGGIWLLGHGMLILLTQWDADWDNVLIAQLTRRYQTFYSAG